LYIKVLINGVDGFGVRICDGCEFRVYRMFATHR
jgi:hypothetical protein